VALSSQVLLPDTAFDVTPQGARSTARQLKSARFVAYHRLPGATEREGDEANYLA